MLVRIWGKGNIYSLLTGVQTDKDAMEIIVKVSHASGNRSYLKIQQYYF